MDPFLVQIIFFIPSILSIGLIIYSYPKRNEKVYQYSLIFALACFITYFPQFLETLINNLQINLFFEQLCSVGFLFIPSIWFFLSYNFSHDGKDLAKKYKILMLIIPIICLFGVLSNPWTGLFYSKITFISNPISNQFTFYPNWMYYLNIYYGSFIILLTLIVLIKETFFNKKIYKKSILMLLIATLISFICNILTVISVNIPSNMLLLIVLTIDMIFYDSLNILPIVNKNVINDIDIGVSFFDKNNKLLSANPASNMLNIQKEDLNKNINEIFENQNQVLDFYYDEKSDKIELPMNDKWIGVTKKNIIKYDEYLGKELTIEDITSKKIELDQKDILIKEVHHRVKSNLQIILSLLNIDLHYHPEDPMTVLNDTRVRLNYMSKLHEYIYKQSEFTEVNIKEYLPQVAESLFNMYDMDIGIHESLKDVQISIDSAIPLGLILTEVISNTVQHAYPNNETKGNFTLESMEDNGDIIVVMRNDGDDLPADFDLDKSNTLGVTIIKSLTQELEGTFEMVSDNGTKVIITFPIK